MTLAPGNHLGPYEILAPLGAGGMGEVYRARDPRLGREVAIKVLPPEFAKDASRLSRFEHEAKTAGALNHPNLLAVYDVGTHEGAPYLVSELLEGATLRKRLTEGPLSPRKAVDYATQIAHGLAAAHDKGIVHRDLKPENLFVTRDERAKVLDFGLAKLRLSEELVQPEAETATSPTTPGTFVGTVGYVSPEQVRGEAADARSDIFAFGAVLYEMLAGKRAFKGATAIETLNAILNEDYPELSATASPKPPALERIVRRCLEKGPEMRFRSAHDLAFALEGLSAPSGSQSATDTGIAPTKGPWPQIGWGLLALALSSLGFLVGRREADRPVPSFQRLTFRRGTVQSARFASDGRTIVYSAAWDGDPIRVFSTRIERPESARIDLPDARVEAVSPSGEMLIRLGVQVSYFDQATLARVPMTGGAPRAIAEDVVGADWGPDGSIAIVRRAGDRNRLEYPAGHLLYETSDFLWPPRLSPNGDLVALYTGGNDTTVSVVDRAGAVRVVSKGWKWHSRYLAWSHAGDEVWFTTSEGGHVNPLRAVTLSGRTRVLLNLPGTTALQDISPEGRVLLTSGPLRIISKCLPPGDTKEHDVSWFEATAVQALSPDGRTVLLNEVGVASGPGPETSTYLRKTDGSPPVKLGDGSGEALSPDGRFVLSRSVRTGERSLLPTGPGDPRRLSFKGINPEEATWHPDGKHLFLWVEANGERKQRCYSFDIDKGALEPVTPEGVGCGHGPSPDGKTLLAQPEGGPYIRYSLADGQTQTIPGLLKTDQPLAWGADSRSLFVQGKPLPRARIDRLDLITGQRQLWREINLADPAGVDPTLSGVTMAENGSYCYTYLQAQSDLYLFDGIR
jgi:eukaryotic-like serine/threonine-protein kinase